MNNKGSILQIVLVIFSIFISVLVLFFNQLISSSSLYNEQILMKQQQTLEISLIHFYQKTLEDDILLSYSYSYKDIDVHYNVDVDFNIYTITTYINSEKYRYSFICEIENEYYQVLSLSYEDY